MTYTSERLKGDIATFMANSGGEQAGMAASGTAAALEKGTVRLVDVVMALRAHMTAEDDRTRMRAMGYLATVLEALGGEGLQRNDIAVMLEFCANKVDDSACAQEALHALEALVGMARFGVGQVEAVLTVLKDQYQPGSYLAATRYRAFRLLEKVLGLFGSALVTNSEQNDLFIETFIAVANGEKDPRNLLLSFRLNMEIGRQLVNVEKFKEDLFDILFCYFPITFKPPKNDPYRITNEDLKQALREAIAGTQLYADDAFGNLVDKLAASSPSVKNDTLLTLQLCIHKFAAEDCAKNWMPIWQALKFEIMNSTESDDPASGVPQFDNYREALETVRLIASKLLHLDMGAFDKFRTHVFDDLKSNFAYEKELKQSCGILSSIASVNRIAFDRVMDKVLPLFFGTQQDLDISKQRLLILNLSFFFDAYIKVFGETGEDVRQVSTDGNKLLGHKDEIIMTLGKALMSSKVEVSLRTLAIIEFTKLIKMQGYLKHEERSMVIQYLTETILTDDNKNIYIACLEGLKVISRNYEADVHEVSLKRILELLPESASAETVIVNGEETSVKHILKVIIDFTSSTHKLVEESIHGLVQKLCKVAPQENSSEYCFLLASSLYCLFVPNGELFTPKDGTAFKESIYPSLMAATLNSTSIYHHDHNLSLLANILSYLNMRSDSAKHHEELEAHQKLFITNKRVLEVPGRSIAVFLNILAGLDKNCKLEDSTGIVKQVVTMLLKSPLELSPFEQLHYQQLLALLANKWCSDKEITEVVNELNLKERSMEILVWLNKGLLMKNSPVATSYLAYFVEQLSRPEGVAVAPYFDILAKDLPIFRRYKGIPFQNNVRLLYKQKLFSDVAVKLVDGFKNTDDLKVKANYLSSLSLILRHTPTDITISYIEELLPLLLQALEFEDGNVRASSLQTLFDTVEHAPQVIAGHVHTLLPRLIQLAQPDRHNKVQVRMLALRTLDALPGHIPLNHLLPFRNDILSGLVPSLGDPKRAVRKQCVDTRQTYYELGHAQA
ncbi:AER377Cp [Eremothecium gossypii ATCC 10895]|uniref:MMS19 nucleotide excision repair protein n=1 Tax=Eremothecium gossypii (strain ATCC 10895 / CBS 109.51 / FGSC 9923 / NRRL Y-1056) TaxID=284811 RepID=Q755Z0_EREGS|nr:AER377Cp [Eremothecium gossypii ATCC 10895]AAS53057.2 AER377Cp [Eremothecium gossypii ATCC 10895]AEY97365.1 FAER377Cp [Eremothecium gossypii FDAG1]